MFAESKESLWMRQFNQCAWQNRAESERGLGLDQYRAALQGRLQRRQTYLELQGVIKQLQRDIDEAEAKHAKVVAPLQKEIARDNLDADSRVAARQKVVEANTKLDETIQAIQGKIHAAEQEATLIAARGIDADGIEAAVADSCGAPDEQIRLQSLRRALNRFEPFVFAQNKKAEYVTIGRHTDPEEIRIEAEIASIFNDWKRQAAAEVEAIRKRRIAQLYT